MSDGFLINIAKNGQSEFGYHGLLSVFAGFIELDAEKLCEYGIFRPKRSM
jgi:hypothetical protein